MSSKQTATKSSPRNAGKGKSTTTTSSKLISPAQEKKLRAGFADKTDDSFAVFASVLTKSLLAADEALDSARVTQFVRDNELANNTFTEAESVDKLLASVADLTKELLDEMSEQSVAGGSQSASEIDGITDTVDFLLRFLLFLRNFEKSLSKSEYLETLTGYINTNAPNKDIRTQVTSLMQKQNLRANQANGPFSKKIINLAIRVLNAAKSIDVNNWFGTLDAQIFVHTPSIRSSNRDEGKDEETKAEAEAKRKAKQNEELLHFTVLCAGTVPNKKTLDRYGFDKKQIDKAQFIFHLFFVLGNKSTTTQGRRVGNAILELQKDIDVIDAILDNVSKTQAIHLTGKDDEPLEDIFLDMTYNFYINYKTVESYQAFLDKLLKNQTVNQLRANRSTRVRSPFPLARQEERKSGPGPNISKASVFISAFTKWLKNEKFPDDFFESVAASAVEALGGNEKLYTEVRRVVADVFGLEQADTLLEMGFTYPGTATSVLQIPLFLGGSATTSLTSEELNRTGVSFKATKALRALLNEKTPYGFTTGNQRVLGTPTTILQISNQSAAVNAADRKARSEIAQDSQIRRNKTGGLVGLNVESMAATDFTKLSKYLTKPLVYLQDGKEVNEQNTNKDILHILNRTVVEGVRPVSTDDMKIGNSRVTAGNIRTALDGEYAGVQLFKKEATTTRDATRKDLVEERERRNQAEESA